MSGDSNITFRFLNTILVGIVGFFAISTYHTVGETSRDMNTVLKNMALYELRITNLERNEGGSQIQNQSFRLGGEREPDPSQRAYWTVREVKQHLGLESNDQVYRLIENGLIEGENGEEPYKVNGQWRIPLLYKRLPQSVDKAATILPQSGKP